MSVKVRRVKFNDEHMDQKYYVIEGYIEGVPAVTKRDTISMTALATGAVSLEERIEKMKADVAEYYANVKALDSLPDELS